MPRRKIAIGLTGEAVPFGIGNGAMFSMNSHRFRSAAASANLSSSYRLHYVRGSVEKIQQRH